MRSATERRMQMLEYLCEVRSTTRAALMDKFHISKNTVDRDLQILMCSHPIHTVLGNGGGIRVADGYYLSRSYMTDGQITLLKNITNMLDGDDLEVMKTIIKLHFPNMGLLIKN